jgi:uncharacterized membrane protein
MKRILPLMLLFLIPLCYSLEYYIDEEITISDNGDAYIEGSTNLDFLEDIHPIDEKIKGMTSELTTKKRKYWLIDLNPEKNVSAAFIKVNLPKGAEINYIKSPLSVSIASANDIITSTFSGQNKPADIKIQYSITREISNNLLLTAFIILAIVAILSFAVIYFMKKKEFTKISLKKLEAIKPTLNETQIKIIDALLEKDGETNQTTIMYMTNLPKSSLSRNVELLAQKQIIQKFYDGTSNYIKIHPSIKK